MRPQTKSDDETTVSQMKLIFNEIQTIYDAGTPIFTKDNIRKVGEELQRFQNGERENGGKVVLKGVNGVDYEVSVAPRGDDPPRENEYFGGSAWAISYRSIQCLTTSYTEAELFDFQSAYLPMRICAAIRLLNNSPEDKEPPAPPVEDFSTYQAMERQWRASQHYEQVQAILATIEVPCSLTKVIGLALGALVPRSQVIKRHVLQHALISAIHSTLVRHGILSVSSKQYVQDPAYSQRARDILHSAGLTVLEDPQALLELDESSVLVCINTELPVEDIVADICRPGIIIWTQRRHNLPLSPRVNSMIENEYLETGFPHHECFGNMVILTRKST
ncbi:hypothetical protein F5Y05DRAFT_50427 [Hypoxylon sp. FL0543]|nr:hypothetical protein F5Y05DRAFT_50427 [Hypoxylon sp. FL0543]